MRIINTNRDKEIERLYIEDGLTMAEIGAIYGITRERVRQIIPTAYKENRPHRRTQRKEMERLYIIDDLTLKQVSAIYKLSRERIRQIIPYAPKAKRAYRKDRENLSPTKQEMRVLRFWSNVNVTTKKNCWNWRGVINPTTGYGNAHWKTLNKSKQVAPHRIAYYLTFGKFPPKGIHVGHTCDNKICCNPRHLMAMSAKENHDDAVRKGRKSGRRKLTDNDVEEIRAKYRGIKSCARIAKEYGVSSQHIYNIAKGRTR